TDLAVLARADRYATGARGIPGSSAVGLWCYDRFTLAVPPSSVVTLWSESEGVQQVDELVHRLVHRSDRVGRGGGQAKSPLPAGLHSALGTAGVGQQRIGEHPGEQLVEPRATGIHPAHRTEGLRRSSRSGADLRGPL